MVQIGDLVNINRQKLHVACMGALFTSGGASGGSRSFSIGSSEKAMCSVLPNSTRVRRSDRSAGTEPAQAAAFGTVHVRHWPAISDWTFSNG